MGAYPMIPHPYLLNWSFICSIILGPWEDFGLYRGTNSNEHRVSQSVDLMDQILSTGMAAMSKTPGPLIRCTSA